MGGLVIRIVLAVVVTTAVALFARTEGVQARELATAQGTITIAAPAAGMANPRCDQLIVEARDALDNHLIADTHGAVDTDGTCKYTLSVPAQSAVWFHLRMALVSSVSTAPSGGEATAQPTGGTAGGDTAVGASRAGHTPSARSVQIRWTVISPNTFFFNPGEQKTIPLSY
jgi:hypothetical protein